MTLDATKGFALDVNGLSMISRAESKSPGAGLKPVAQQFEAMFMNMMLKSMRAAVPQSGMLDSEAMKSFGQMRDQQLSQSLASRGMGIADMLMQQLGPKSRAHAPDTTQDMLAGLPVAQPQRLGVEHRATTDRREAFRETGNETAMTRAMAQADDSLRDMAPHVSAFLDRIGDTARKISADSGISARLIMAQAALETGWGRHDVSKQDGSAGNNLFGIKAAGARHTASRATATTEYEQGVAQTRREQFRTYDSDEGSMRDYARLLNSLPRYQGVAGSSGEEGARKLQAGGYATDPRYAEKLIAIMSQLPHSLEARMGSSMNALADAGLEGNPTQIF